MGGGPLNRVAAFVLLLTVLFPPVSRAGAWLQEPGSAYVRLAFGYLTTRERFDLGGNRVPYDSTRATRYQDVTTALYVEAGILPGWNVVADVTWKVVEAVQPSARFWTWGPGDVRLAVKRSLLRKARVVSSAGIVVTIPTGYDEEEFPSLGSGVAEVGVFGGVGASGPGYWLNGEAAARIRGGSFRNQVEAAVGGGFGLGSRVNARGEVRGGFPFGTAEIDPDAFTDPALVDPTWLDLAGTLSVNVTRGIAVEVEARAPVTGENTLSGARWSLALATSPAWRWR